MFRVLRYRVFLCQLALANSDYHFPDRAPPYQEIAVVD
jgi:hypothetical protein